MKSYRLSELTHPEVNSLKARPRIDFSSIFSVVNPIVDDVRCRGYAAVIDYTARFDKVVLDEVVELVSDLPDPKLDPAVREAFDVAYDNIYAFHAAQRVPEKDIENMAGVRCKRIAVLPSTALMLSVGHLITSLHQPAQIAGCKTIVLATPPGRDGSICKEVLYCAKKAGVTHILKAGGAQAISAMAWGTSSCPKITGCGGGGEKVEKSNQVPAGKQATSPHKKPRKLHQNTQKSGVTREVACSHRCQRLLESSRIMLEPHEPKSYQRKPHSKSEPF